MLSDNVVIGCLYVTRFLCNIVSYVNSLPVRSNPDIRVDGTRFTIDRTNVVL